MAARFFAVSALETRGMSGTHWFMELASLVLGLGVKDWAMQARKTEFTHAP